MNVYVCTEASIEQFQKANNQIDGKQTASIDTKFM